MPVTPGHFTLTPEQRQFKQLLDQFPSLIPFWDFESRGCDVPALERAIPAMSHGEQIMAQFFAAVWLGENQLKFDLLDAARPWTIHTDRSSLAGCPTPCSHDARKLSRRLRESPNGYHRT